MKRVTRIAKKRVTTKGENESRFSIHDLPTPAILYTRKNPVIVEWNSAASKLLGYKPGERLYLKVIRPKGMRARRNVSGSKEGVSMGIVPHTTGTGEEKLIEVINKLITIDGKEYYLEWLVDQTALVQSQLSQRHFYGAVTRASMVSRTDPKGNITYINANFIKISGYTQRDLLRKNHRLLSSHHHPSSFWITMWNTITSGKTWREEVKNKAKDGSYYWVDTLIIPFMDEQGKVREFLSLQNDITQRKESEEALAQYHSSLSATLLFGKMGSAVLDLKTLQLTVNKELFQLLKVPFPEAKRLSLKSFLKTYVQSDFIPLINSKIMEGSKGLTEDRKVVAMEMLTYSNRRIHVEAEILFNKTTALAIFHDVTDRIIAISDMREKEERFRTLISDISIGVVLQGPRSEVHLTNQAALDLLGLTEDQLLGRTSYNPVWNIIHEDGSEFKSEDLPVPRSIATKQSVRGVVMGVYRPRLNDRVWLLVDAVPRLDEKGDIKNVICTFNNITDLKAAESSLHFTRFTIDHTSDAVFWIRPDASVADMNPAAHTSLGYSAEEMLKMSMADIDLSFTYESWARFWKYLKDKKTATSISKQRRKDGAIIDVEISSNFIVFRGAEFNCSFVRDITERKKSELALIDSNQEKDMLIKEIHHRVKNNLQLISSILYIKMNGMLQSEMKDFLEDTRLKIRSIALIHERLLQANSVNQVDISDYLGKLISDLEMSNTRHELRINIEQDIEPEYMNLDTAIYCGLIINELVTNSIKHAFVERNVGNIRIVLRKMGDIHHLVVSDDGISMPNEIGVGHTGSFGMQMLEIFTKQLKGKVEITRENGTSINVHF
ncbi:MAG: hypothetical protein C0523_09805 [Cytophaga sp.]|nr:hypothetical protein [Cytophaga sp.]